MLELTCPDHSICKWKFWAPRSDDVFIRNKKRRGEKCTKQSHPSVETSALLLHTWSIILHLAIKNLSKSGLYPVALIVPYGMETDNITMIL